MPDQKLLVSLHHGHHNKTPQDQFGRINNASPWIPAELDALELIEHISAGKAWIGCQLKAGERNEDNAGAWNTIVLDIDGDLPLDAFWAIPFVQRHCLFSYTSPSHRKVTEKNPEAKDRFRAIFWTDRPHTDIELHRQLHALVLERCGLELKDTCGEKPERLWYGYDATEIQTSPQAIAALSWDLVELAGEEAAAEKKRQEQKRQAATAITDVDLQRADYVLRHILAPSGVTSQGDGYESYWMPVFQAAASAGYALFDAFMEWSSKGGHHASEGRRLERGNRWARAGGRSGITKLFALAKQQHGDRWQELLPEELRYQGAPSPPIVLYKATDLSVEPPPPFEPGKRLNAPPPDPIIPDAPPTPEQLSQLATGRHILHRGRFEEDADPGDRVVPPPPAGNKSAPKDESNLGTLLERIYLLRAHRLNKQGDDLIPISGREAADLDRKLLSEILEYKGYCGSAAEVERDLIHYFRDDHGLEIDDSVGPAQVILDGLSGPKAKFLIPGFFMEGQEHVIHAKPGTGKTVLAIHSCRALVGDPAITEFIDSGPLNNTHRWKKSRVLFIASDMGVAAEEMTNTYLDKFRLAGLPFLQQVDWWINLPGNKHCHWRLTLPDLVRLDRHLEGMKHQGTPVAAVIIDSMKSVCPDHILVGNQVFKNYLDLVSDICNRHGAAVIWIHHSRGDGTGAQGIQRITEGASAVFRLDPVPERKREVQLKVEKIRGGAISRTLTINPFAWGEPELIQADTDGGEESVMQEGPRRIEAILRILNQDQADWLLANPQLDANKDDWRYRGLSRTQISQRLSGIAISDRNLKRILADLVERKEIVLKGRSKNSTYRVPNPWAAQQPQSGDLFTDLDG